VRACARMCVCDRLRAEGVRAEGLPCSNACSSLKLEKQAQLRQKRNHAAAHCAWDGLGLEQGFVWLHCSQASWTHSKKILRRWKLYPAGRGGAGSLGGQGVVRAIVSTRTRQQGQQGPRRRAQGHTQGHTPAIPERASNAQELRSARV